MDEDEDDDDGAGFRLSAIEMGNRQPTHQRTVYYFSPGTRAYVLIDVNVEVGKRATVFTVSTRETY